MKICNQFKITLSLVGLGFIFVRYKSFYRITQTIFFIIASSICFADGEHLRQLTDAERQVIATGAAWASIISLSDGSLGLVVQKGQALSEIDAVNVSIEWRRSIDAGKSWSAPVVIAKRLGQDNKLFDMLKDGGYVVYQERNQAVGQLSSGRIIVAHSRLNYFYGADGKPKKAPNSDGVFDNIGVFYTWSEDSGVTWQNTQQLSLGPFDGSKGGASPHGRIIELHDGTALMSLYGSFNPEYTGPIVIPKGSKALAGVIRSKDQGKTWGDISLILSNRGPISYEETSLCDTGNNTLLAHVRTKDSHVDQYSSMDSGRHWSKMGAVTENQQHPATAFRLKSGKLMLTWGNRKPSFGAAAMLSSNNGQTWDYGHTVTLASDVLGPNSGYANAAQAGDGSIVAVYYAMPNGGSYRDLWKKSYIYSIRFTEKQFIRAGQQEWGKRSGPILVPSLRAQA